MACPIVPRGSEEILPPAMEDVGGGAVASVMRLGRPRRGRLHPVAMDQGPRRSVDASLSCGPEGRHGVFIVTDGPASCPVLGTRDQEGYEGTRARTRGRAVRGSGRVRQPAGRGG